MWISAEFALLVSDWVEYWLATYQNPIQQSTSSYEEAAAKAYIESSQALNRTIHTAIHQQTDTLREALKVLESNNKPAVVTTSIEIEQQEQQEEVLSTTTTISIDQIKLPPSQPRRYFDLAKLEELSRSIKQFGILEPLLVCPLPGGEYELVAGERRSLASIMAGLTEAPSAKVLYQRFIDISKRIKESKILFDPKKRKKLEKLLHDIEKVLTDSP